MPRTIFLTVPGKAQSKQRPRVMKTGITFTPKETVNAEAFIRGLALEAMGGQKPLEGGVELSIRIFRTIPKSFGKKKKAQAMAGLLFPTTRPDMTNQIKLIEDALNGIAYIDDAQVVFLEAKKFYTNEQERTEAEVREI